MINTAYNLDCYEHFPDVYSIEDYISHRCDDDPVKIANADFDALKLEIRDNNGEFNDFGYVARKSGAEIQQVYEPPDIEQNTGIQMGGT